MIRKQRWSDCSRSAHLKTTRIGGRRLDQISRPGKLLIQHASTRPGTWAVGWLASFLFLFFTGLSQAEDTVKQPSENKTSSPTSSDLNRLLNAVKLQIQTVEELKKQNTALVRQNEELNNRLKKLEIKVEAPKVADYLVGKVGSDQPSPSSLPNTNPDSIPADLPPQVKATAPASLTTGITSENADGVPEFASIPSPNAELPPDVQVQAEPSANPIFEQPAANLNPSADTAPLNLAAQPNSDLAPPVGGAQARPSEFLLGRYDNGFVLVAPKNPKETPFAMKANIVTQERYTGFFRNVENWQPMNQKIGTPVNNRSTFDVNRAYLGFSGFALDPKLQYSFILATTSTVNVSYILAVLGYQFNKEFGLFGGFNKVPGSREWFESFKNTMGVDRSLATTFFRPSMSPGVWITGEPLTNFHYYGMISNSINSLTQLGDRQTTQMCYSGNLWWEPLGSFGPGFADAEFHENLAIRLGTTGLYERQNRQVIYTTALDNPENTVTRLSNGIAIFDPGAIAPGVNLLSATNRFWSVDAGLKYRGLGLSGEYYFRWLDNFQTNKPLPGIQKIFDSGGYLQLSYAVLPKKLEFYSKTSLVAGPYGSGNDYGGGLNWYVNGSRKWRATAEVLQVNRSPAFNILTPYRVGQSGTIMMFQLLTDF